jgi:hypothetical protein
MKRHRTALDAEQVEALKTAPIGTAPNRLQIAFALANVKQSIACEALGWSASDMSKLVRGAYQSVDVEKARSLAEYFGCGIEDLFPAKQEVA